MEVYTYKTSGGKDLIFEYIDNLTKDERVDALSVLECMENNRLDELNIKQWQGKVQNVLKQENALCRLKK